MSESEDKGLEKIRDTQRTVNAYHRMFKSADGKLVLADMGKAFRWDAPTFLNLSAAKGEIRFDPIHAAKRDGLREVKLRIDAMLSAQLTGDANRTKANPKSKTS